MTDASAMRLARPAAGVYSFLGIFVAISIAMVLGWTMGWDVAILRAAGAFRAGRPALITTSQFLSNFGYGKYEIPAAFGMAGIIWWLGRRDRALRLICAGLSGELLYVIAKEVFRRPRPEVIPHLSQAGWYSYPSGHAMLAPIVWWFGLYLMARSQSSRAVEITLITVGTMITVLLAASRVILGVHYPSDVLGALALGIGWVLLWREPGPSSSSATSPAPAIR